MNIERLQLKGLLAESRKQYRTLDTEASALIILLRSIISPFVPVTELDMEKIKVTIGRLDKITAELKTLQHKIERLESELE